MRTWTHPNVASLAADASNTVKNDSNLPFFAADARNTVNRDPNHASLVADASNTVMKAPNKDEEGSDKHAMGLHGWAPGTAWVVVDDTIPCDPIPPHASPSALLSSQEMIWDLRKPLVTTSFYGGELLTCVLCDSDPTKDIYTHSWDLVGTILGCQHQCDEEYITDERTLLALRNTGDDWTDQYYMLVTYRGTRALGAGRNKQRCQRAARLALAATAFVLDGETDMPNPTNDYAFSELVERVRKARCDSDIESHLTTQPTSLQLNRLIDGGDGRMRVT